MQHCTLHELAAGLRDAPDLAVLRLDQDWLICWGAQGFVRPGPGWVERARALVQTTSADPSVPFAGGLVGWLGYGAGAHVERMPAPWPNAGPELCLRRYPGALWGGPGRWRLAGSPEWVRAARARLERLGPVAPPPPAVGCLLPEPDPAAFERAVQVALDRIAAGDLYQTNLCRRLQVTGVDHPVDVWRRLPGAAWQALLMDGARAVVSDSPELFLSVQGGVVRSRPIKGTRPLGQEAALLEDPKERAELTMIVDLVRNDLSRVCVPGSVRAGPRHVQSLATLAHAHQQVRGQLSPGRDALDAVAASFPPGSVTGAPKVQAMALIRELEQVPRGVYTGAIGAFADGGDAWLSVAIRVAQIQGDRADLHVGCGIVADSQPARELEESRLKAQSLLRALCPVQPSIRSAAWGQGPGGGDGVRVGQDV